MSRRTAMVPVTEAREKMKDILGMLEDSTVTLVRHSRPAAIMLSPERYYELLDAIEHLENQCSVLHAQLHPEEADSWEKAKAELGSLHDVPS